MASWPSFCWTSVILPKILKHALPLLSETLLKVMNNSLISGYVPQSFKIAMIKPFLKKPNLDPDNLANYQPISNHPFLSKILEKIIAKQLTLFLHKKYIEEDFQSGFRAHQLYLFMKPDEIVHLPKIETCLQDVKSWMANNILLR